MDERVTGEVRALLPPLRLVTTGMSLDWGDLIKEQNQVGKELQGHQVQLFPQHRQGHP